MGDIQEARPNLCRPVHGAVHRLMQVTLRDILIRDFDVETADRIFFNSVKKKRKRCETSLNNKRTRFMRF